MFIVHITTIEISQNNPSNKIIKNSETAFWKLFFLHNYSTLSYATVT